MIKKYKMRVVRGAFVDTSVLDKLGAETLEDLGQDEWVSIDWVIADIDQIKEMQKLMIKHFGDSSVPWYMDGYEVDNKNQVIVAFGADDGEGGKIFQFERNDKNEIKKVVDFGVSKGIPKEQMDFDRIDF